MRTLSGIFGSRDPLAITRFIIAIIIDAVDGQVVLIAIGKRPITEWLESLPFTAKFDPAPSVAMPVFVTRIIAAVAKNIPKVRHPRIGSAMCLQSAGRQFAIKASTRFGVTRSKIGTANDCLVSAITLAQPCGVPASLKG